MKGDEGESKEMSYDVVEMALSILKEINNYSENKGEKMKGRGKK